MGTFFQYKPCPLLIYKVDADDVDKPNSVLNF